ncbi:hypothetical protein [Caballeronia catudaia]|uniref:hypothetical protein n=1 Tax=Caballeronia catudaia TaxID=1777136 RepID=UPI001F20FE3B|nr:hypothetical protein [Caballeronia catudaia]
MLHQILEDADLQRHLRRGILWESERKALLQLAYRMYDRIDRFRRSFRLRLTRRFRRNARFRLRRWFRRRCRCRRRTPRAWRLFLCCFVCSLFRELLFQSGELFEAHHIVPVEKRCAILPASDDGFPQGYRAFEPPPFIRA